MQVKLNTLPATLAEFQALPRSTPEEVCAGFLCALNLYTKSPNDGVAAMDLLRGPRPMTPYDSQFLRDRLRGKEYLPLAYFDGATPQNGYRPTAPYTLTVLPDQRPQDVEEGYLRVFLQTARIRPGPSSCGRSPPPANGSCGSIPARSAVSGYRPRRTRGRKAAVDPSMTTR